jgi:hypothetical protein
MACVFDDAELHLDGALDGAPLDTLNAVFSTSF